jgi:hypothetical protein
MLATDRARPPEKSAGSIPIIHCVFGPIKRTPIKSEVNRIGNWNHGGIEELECTQAVEAVQVESFNKIIMFRNYIQGVPEVTTT